MFYPYKLKVSLSAHFYMIEESYQNSVIFGNLSKKSEKSLKIGNQQSIFDELISTTTYIDDYALLVYQDQKSMAIQIQVFDHSSNINETQDKINEVQKEENIIEVGSKKLQLNEEIFDKILVKQVKNEVRGQKMRFIVCPEDLGFISLLQIDKTDKSSLKSANRVGHTQNMVQLVEIRTLYLSSTEFYSFFDIFALTSNFDSLFYDNYSTNDTHSSKNKSQNEQVSIICRGEYDIYIIDLQRAEIGNLDPK